MKRIGLVVVLASTGLLILVPLILLSTNSQALIFNLAGFINKCFDFALELTSIFLSFVLLNLFWERQQKKQRITLVRQRLNLSLNQFRRLLAESISLLDIPFSEKEDEAIQEREKKVLQHFDQIQFLRQGLVLHFPEGESVEDNRLARSLDYFWSEAVPTIDDLSKRDAIYPNVDEVKQDLNELRNSITAIQTMLREDNNTHTVSLGSTY